MTLVRHSPARTEIWGTYIRSPFTFIRRLALAIALSGLLPAYGVPSFGRANLRDVTLHGAIADGTTKNTAALNTLIAEVAGAGGGTLYFPPGVYLTGTVHLRSNVTLWLEAGAVVRGSGDIDDYPDLRTRSEGIECWGYAALIRATEARNVSIRGRGTIDGQGQAWWARGFLLRDHPNPTELLNARERRFAELNRATGGKAYVRPCLVEFYACHDVLVEGVTLTNSPMWTLHPVYCDNVTITGVTIQNPPDSKNTDGINPDSSTNVRISNCNISTGDDCIAIKSGKDADGRRVGRASENITITNCTMSHGHGGVVIGSEMSGDVRNVVVSNCVFSGTKRGIRFKAPRGRGGVIENVLFQNIAMHDVGEAAIIVDMIYGYTGPAPVAADITTPKLRGITISNVRAQGVAQAFLVEGLPESPIRDLRLAGIEIAAAKPGWLRHVAGLSIRDSTLALADAAALEITGITNADTTTLQLALLGAGLK